MKFKIGQKIRMVKDEFDARVGHVGIIKSLTAGRYYAVEFPCLEGTNKGHSCDGLVPSGNGYWIPENYMELASEQEEPMTLKEKLRAFKSGTAVFHAPTQETYDRLMKELEDRGYKWCSGRVAGDNSFDRWGHFKEMTCVSNRTDGMYYCDRAYYESGGIAILEITEEDFPEITQVTVIGEPKNPCVIKFRAKVTKGNDGYTIEKLAEPKFTVGEQFATASGKLGKVTKVNPEGNYCVQWFNGKSCSAQPEDAMHKIVWGN